MKIRLLATIAQAALLLLFSTVNAAAQSRLNCTVGNFQNLRPDGQQDSDFAERNRQKRYEITVTNNSIVTVFTFNGQLFSLEYLRAQDTMLEISGSKIDITGTGTIVIGRDQDKRYNYMYPASITQQSGSVVNAWLLLCSRSN